MSSARRSAGDVVSSASKVIEVRVAELRQLFNAIDPSPFRERDLDPRAEAFIVGWARDLPRDAPLALLVHLERACGPEDEATMLGDAIHGYFKQRALEFAKTASRAVSTRSHQPCHRRSVPERVARCERPRR